MAKIIEEKELKQEKLDELVIEILTKERIWIHDGINNSVRLWNKIPGNINCEPEEFASTVKRILESGVLELKVTDINFEFEMDDNQTDFKIDTTGYAKFVRKIGEMNPG